MFVEIVPRLGGRPVRLEAAQLIVHNDAGTPVCVAGEYGPRAVRVAHAKDPDFERTLRAFGYGGHSVVIESLDVGRGRVGSPLPAGARLVAGPPSL